ncbi:ribonuclease-like protein H2 subunit C [Saccharata proteae CBS 121410]|uniref:Ribonuclease-like protein H2 subunit C n=1 Tax=Saccharata proteae CBS 121410 TaxID=1314787 RepID=A0A9P4HM01_9PEZI|nr:ribonuclease-like protein H2 subunit C [Saccharata proteae CBS 121410]
MLAIQQTKTSADKCTPNLLPCRVHHDGPVNATDRYWRPANDGDDTQTSYFRGRKLRGRTVPVPQGYRGPTNRILPTQPNETADVDGDDDMNEERPIETKVAEEVASFDEMVLWNHETLPDGVDDAYVKGVKEWIAFAEAIHTTPAVEKTPDKA